MLNLEVTPPILMIEPKIIYSTNNLKVYDTNSNDWAKRGAYAFDDGAYVAKIDFLLKNIYDDNYFNNGTVWAGEFYLQNKIKPIERLTTNISFYKRYNILGPNNSDRDTVINKLESRFK